MASNTQIPETRQEYLGAIPLLMSYFDRLHIKDIVDQALPVAGQAHVTHGESVIAMLLAMFLREHRLYQVDERLKDIDLAGLLRHQGLTADQFTDNRLGWSLDALYGNTARLYASVIFAAIKTFGLKIKRLHADFTSIVLHGAYPGSESPLSGLLQPPVPARGFSKDHRPDLLQLVWGLVMSEEGVPLIGNFENGNAAEPELFRKQMVQLAGMLEDLRSDEAVMIGDSKLCSIATMAQAADLKMPILTLIPETWNLRAEAIDHACKQKDLPVLMVTEEGEEYRGTSWDIPVLIEEPGKPGRSVWLRVMAVYSSQLSKQKAAGRLNARKKEEERLKTWAQKLEGREFACEADARKIVSHEWKATKAQYHSMSFDIIQEEKPEKRRPGRPPKGASAKSTPIWRVRLNVSGQGSISAEGLDPDGFFVLLTTVTDRRKMSDVQMLTLYKEQKTVEIGFHWLKGPMAMGPIFLKTPERIQAMGFIFLLALLTGALIQRDLRKSLRKRGGTVAYLGHKRTDAPTWNSILTLFDAIRATQIRIDGVWHRILHLFDKDHQEVLTLLNLENIYENNSCHVYS